MTTVKASIRWAGVDPVSPQAAMVPSSLTVMKRDGAVMARPVRLVPSTMKSVVLPLNTWPVGLDGVRSMAGVGFGAGRGTPLRVGGVMSTGEVDPGAPGTPSTDRPSCVKGTVGESPTYRVTRAVSVLAIHQWPPAPAGRIAAPQGLMKAGSSSRAPSSPRLLTRLSCPKAVDVVVMAFSDPGGVGLTQMRVIRNR